MPSIRMKVTGLEAVQRAVTAYPRKAKEVTRSWARDVAYEQRDLIRGNIHNRTGNTARYGVQVFEQTQGEKGYFEIRLGQVVQWLDRGTGLFGPLHRLITARSGGMLKFIIGGVTLFRRSVRGMEAQHVIGAGVSEMASRMPTRIKELRQRLGALWGRA